MSFDLSLVMPIYNQADFIEASVRSVLAQDCPPTEILISDDGSTDGTFDIARKLTDAYAGPHQVRLWQNEKNIGTGNLAKCVGLARHRRIVAFHGDDVAYPNRAERLHAAFETTGASLISTNSRLIDHNGDDFGPLVEGEASRFLDIAQLAAGWQRTQSGSTVAFDRDILDRFLPWAPDTYWMAHDHVLPFRAAMLQGAYYLEETLLDRRQHPGNFGKQGRPRFDDQAHADEFRLARFLNLRAFMLLDLEHHIETYAETDRTREGRDCLMREVKQALFEWSKVRSRLFNEGDRPHWLNAADTDKSPGFFKRLRQGLKRLLK